MRCSPFHIRKMVAGRLKEAASCMKHGAASSFSFQPLQFFSSDISPYCDVLFCALERWESIPFFAWPLCCLEESPFLFLPLPCLSNSFTPFERYCLSGKLILCRFLPKGERLFGLLQNFRKNYLGKVFTVGIYKKMKLPRLHNSRNETLMLEKYLEK